MPAAWSECGVYLIIIEPHRTSSGQRDLRAPAMPCHNLRRCRCRISVSLLPHGGKMLLGTDSVGLTTLNRADGRRGGLHC